MSDAEAIKYINRKLSEDFHKSGGNPSYKLRVPAPVQDYDRLQKILDLYRAAGWFVKDFQYGPGFPNPAGYGLVFSFTEAQHNARSSRFSFFGE